MRGYSRIKPKRQLKNNEDFQKFIKNYNKEIWRSKENECARYVHFCGLDPTVPYYKKYPMNHSTKIFNPEKFDKT